MTKKKYGQQDQLHLNDETDTIFVLQYYNVLKKYILESLQKFDQFSSEDIEKIFNEAEQIGKASKYVSMRTMKDLILLCTTKYSNTFGKLLMNFNDFQSKASSYGYRLDINQMFKMICIEFNDLWEVLEIEDKDIPNKEVIYKAIEGKHPYCICFTQAENDKRMWEEYTKNEGVCLEFKKDEMEKYTKDANILANPICYIDADDIQNSIITTEKLFKMYFELFNRLKKENKCINEYSEILYFLGCFVKDKKWYEDKEYRMVVTENCIMPRSDLRVYENYYHKYDRGLKTQDYIKVRIPQYLVKSIRRGPNNTDELFQNYFGCNDLEFEKKYGIKVYS